MAEVKVSALTALTGANVANGDEMYIVDTGSPNVSKKITVNELAQASPFSSRYAPAASASGRFARKARNTGNIVINSTSFTSLDASIDDLTVTVAAGQHVLLSVSAAWNNEAVFGFLDIATIVSGSVVNVLSKVAGGATHAANGIQALSGWTGQYEAVAAAFVYPVVAGDVSAGSVTFRLYGKTATAANKTLYANGNQELVWSALVVG